MANTDRLSEREIEVAEVLLQGKSNKQIALALGISVHTVEYHLKNIYQKLGVSSSKEAILVLGKTPGWRTRGKLGESAVAGGRGIGDNGDGSALPGPGTLAGAGEMQQKKPAKFFGKYTILIAFGLVLLGGLVYMLTRPAPWQSYARECEYPDDATVGQMIWRQNASGSKVHGQFGTTADAPYPPQAGYVIYKGISLPQVDQLYLKLSYSKYSPTAVPILVYVDNEPEPRASIFPVDQQSWDQFTWTEPISLGGIAGGVHMLKLSTAGQEYGVADLDKLILTKQ